MKALVIYEEQFLDTKSQENALMLIMSYLQRMYSFDADSFNMLSSKCLQLCSRILKRTDQCYFTLLCTHLFWSIRSPTSQVKAYYRYYEVLIIMDYIYNHF
jgi:hypothetical protein